MKHKETKVVGKKEYLTLFIVLTLGITWGFGFLPVALGITGTPLGTFLFYFGAGAPSVVALIIVFITYSKSQKKDYFKRCFSISKKTLKWMGFTTLFWIVNAIIGLVIAVGILKYPMPEMNWIHLIVQKPYLFFIMVVLSIVSGPLNEEFGWRGYAQDRLFDKFGFLLGALILGFIWGIWHLPWYFTPGQAQYMMAQTSLWDSILFIVSSMTLAVVVAFVYIQTNRNILAGAYVHMASNFFTSQLLADYCQQTATVIRYVAIVMGVVVMIYAVTNKNFKEKYKNLMREYRLSYD